MSKTIHDVLMKVPNQGKRTSITNTIKASTGVFMNYIGSFMTLIDRMFDKTFVNSETVPQLISFWGYPENTSKSVFKAIGAPHTWNTCLHMMEFLA